MTCIEQFKDLAERYGFKMIQDGEKLSLCAKNTDGHWTRWIRYDSRKNEVALQGETDYLNIWLYETKPDMTPEKCIAFVDELNDIFDFHGSDKILLRDLIDPEDWQEIADVRDASEDERYGKLIGIGGCCCIQVDEWRTNNNTFVLGMNLADRSFFHASVNGRDFFEYDEGPTREKVESDYVDLEAARQFDQYEAEFGADGRRAFPNLNDDISDEETTGKDTYTITDYLGEKVELALRVELYEVQDFMGETLPGLAIVLDAVDPVNGENEQYGVLTVSFGEFIGMKNCAYIDTNNCSFAEQLLKYGFAEQTGFRKESGFCSYPLWQFKEEFLIAHGGEKYKEYSDAYDRYMGFEQEEDEREASDEKYGDAPTNQSLADKISLASERSKKGISTDTLVVRHDETPSKNQEGDKYER